MADKQCYIMSPSIVSTSIELYCNVFFGAKRETATVLTSLIGNHAWWKTKFLAYGSLQNGSVHIYIYICTLCASNIPQNNKATFTMTNLSSQYAP